jgi:hypothetical protein
MNRYIDEIAQLLPIDVVKKLDKLTVLRVAVDTIKHLKGKKNILFKKKSQIRLYRFIFKSHIEWLR